MIAAAAKMKADFLKVCPASATGLCHRRPTGLYRLAPSTIRSTPGWRRARPMVPLRPFAAAHGGGEEPPAVGLGCDGAWPLGPRLFLDLAAQSGPTGGRPDLAAGDHFGDEGLGVGQAGFAALGQGHGVVLGAPAAVDHA